ncbi:MAG: hypothetical protein AB1479_09910 [Pseudomonadota bacterium]
MTTLTIHTIPPLVLTAPDLMDVTGQRRALGGESPVLTVRLDNARGHLTALFSTPPVRAVATIDGVGGIVQAVRMGSIISIQVEI